MNDTRKEVKSTGPRNKRRRNTPTSLARKRLQRSVRESMVWPPLYLPPPPSNYTRPDFLRAKYVPENPVSRLYQMPVALKIPPPPLERKGLRIKRIQAVSFSRKLIREIQVENRIFKIQRQIENEKKRIWELKNEIFLSDPAKLITPEERKFQSAEEEEEVTKFLSFCLYNFECEISNFLEESKDKLFL